MDLPKSTGGEPIGSRKADHLRINLNEDVGSKGLTSGFERYRLVPCALPEIDFEHVDTSTDLFGYRLSAPLLISGMTGGVPEAEAINRTLAAVAQQHKIAMGLGSGRVLLERPEVLSSFSVRALAPDVPLLANLGAVQLNRGVGVDQCRRLVEMLEADALVLHLNGLQEALQPGGDTCFGDLSSRIRALCRELDAPVVVKEVGWGIAPDVVLRLLDAGVAAVDVAGAGGTSWSEVERHRLSDPVRARVAAAFAGWGLPTAEAISQARAVAPDAALWASGGVQPGLDVVKAVSLGADIVGMAGPFLRAAVAGSEAASDLTEELIGVLRTAMFCLGVSTLAELHNSPRVIARQSHGV